MGSNSTGTQGFKNIVLHWTGGGSYPNESELAHYHFLIDSEGKVHRGLHSPEDNLDCTDGNYAAHCGGGNTERIGVALCGMYEFNNSLKYTKFPLTAKQCEAAFELCAKLCKKYKLQPNQVITHAEFGKKFPQTTSKGKIDIIYIPHISLEGIDKVGSYVRNKVNWYYSKLKNK